LTTEDVHFSSQLIKAGDRSKENCIVANLLKMSYIGHFPAVEWYKMRM